MSLYTMRLGTTYDSQEHRNVEVFTIDREPQGPLANYVEQDDGRTACEPCSMSVPSNNTRLRWIMKLPYDVRRKYKQRYATDYVDEESLPGMLTWMSQNGYIVIDMGFARPMSAGLWIQYEGETDEFTDDGGGLRGGGGLRRAFDQNGNSRMVNHFVARALRPRALGRQRAASGSGKKNGGGSGGQKKAAPQAAPVRMGRRRGRMRA